MSFSYDAKCAAWGCNGNKYEELHFCHSFPRPKNRVAVGSNGRQWKYPKGGTPLAKIEPQRDKML